jgi:hypothetical protein
MVEPNVRRRVSLLDVDSETDPQHSRVFNHSIRAVRQARRGQLVQSLLEEVKAHGQLPILVQAMRVLNPDPSQKAA